MQSYIVASEASQKITENPVFTIPVIVVVVGIALWHLVFKGRGGDSGS